MTVTGVTEGFVGYPPLRHVIIEFEWFKDDGAGHRKYQGAVHYAASGVGHQPLWNLEQYSLTPAAGLLTYFMGFVEADSCMTMHMAVFVPALDAASRDLPSGYGLWR